MARNQALTGCEFNFKWLEETRGTRYAQTNTAQASAETLLRTRGIRNAELHAALVIELHGGSQIHVGQRNLPEVMIVEYHHGLIHDGVVFDFLDAPVEK